MAGLNTGATPQLAYIFIATTLVIVGLIVAAHWIMRNRTLEAAIARIHPAVVVGVLTLMAYAIVIEHGTGDAFIYFQF
jgi:alginate O-acetyltransferase complex protein AlgI